jgi:hypothetical protein
MIKLIVGKKGSGKTKILVERINEAAKASKGNVICIEKDLQLTYNIDHSVRLINIVDYKVEGFDAFYGFITGVLAGNYDITDIFVDGTLRIGNRDMNAFAAMVEKLNALNPEANILFTVSCDGCDIPESIKGFIE